MKLSTWWNNEFPVTGDVQTDARESWVGREGGERGAGDVMEIIQALDGPGYETDLTARLCFHM